MPIKLISVFGTRPEAVKMCPLVKYLEADGRFLHKTIATAQHREMLDSVLGIFKVRPAYDLNLMKHGQNVADIASGVLKGVYEILSEEKPDMVLVHGDTSTAFNAAQAAFYLKIPICHVEAGLRSGDLFSPFPEEFNRRGISLIASLNLCPTEGNRANLLAEGAAASIAVTGNTVIDALKSVLDSGYRFEDPLLDGLSADKKIILLTCHRRENWGKPMEAIFRAVLRIIKAHPDTELIFPVHPNPTVKNMAESILSGQERIRLIAPLDYVPFANLMNKAHLVLTDSGGIQEEAPALGKPVVVLRTETERPEAVKAGTVAMAGIDETHIFQTVSKLLSDTRAYNAMAHAANPYGDGTACAKSADAIAEYFKDSPND